MLRALELIGSLWGSKVKYKYDAITNAFYPIALKASYTEVGLWPKEGVFVDEYTFSVFQKPPKGKQRAAGNNGHPTWVDISSSKLEE